MGEKLAALELCPLCGNRAFTVIANEPGHRAVWCLTDGCLRLPPRESEAAAITAWNTRTLASTTADAVAQEREAIAVVCDNLATDLREEIEREPEGDVAQLNRASAYTAETLAAAIRARPPIEAGNGKAGGGRG